MIKHKINEVGNIIYHIWDNKCKYSFTLEQSQENYDVYNLFRIGNSTIIETVNAFELHDFILDIEDKLNKLKEAIGLYNINQN